MTPEIGNVLPDRSAAIAPPPTHFVSGHPLTPPWPEGFEESFFGMGCFWGAERLFWGARGVFVTAVGYQGGTTRNATYRDVCSGRTGHAEIVRVVFDPKHLNYEELLRLFWENHDPTQGMRQGNDIGSQYRSALYTVGSSQHELALLSRDAYAERLKAAGHGAITTEIRPAPDFYFAEEYHQQYLAKNPAGYCGLAGTGVACPSGIPVAG